MKQNDKTQTYKALMMINNIAEGRVAFDNYLLSLKKAAWSSTNSLDKYINEIQENKTTSLDIDIRIKVLQTLRSRY